MWDLLCALVVFSGMPLQSSQVLRPYCMICARVGLLSNAACFLNKCVAD